MKLKKASAAFSLLSILCLFLHLCYNVFGYLTLYYNPTLQNLFAYPFMVLVCAHAVCGMLTVFLQIDGGRPDLYPKQNLRTILQRVSAALIFPLLLLHINNFALMEAVLNSGHKIGIIALMIVQILFYAVVITHAAVSVTKGLITLGLLSDERTQRNLDRILYVIGAILFCVSVFAIMRGQAALFLSA